MPGVAFFGSHTLGVSCLEMAHTHPDIEIAVVVTYPVDYDRWWEGSVHDRAEELGYPILTIEQEREVLDYSVEYLFSVYYPNIIGPDLLNHPTELPLNLHQAELPRYRGSNVFSHSIMNARADDYWRHGTTLHVMAEEVDAGDVIDRRFAEITEEDTAWSLYRKVRQESVELFEDGLDWMETGEVGRMRTPQEVFEGPRYFYTKQSLDGEKEIPIRALVDSGNEVELYDKIRALDFPPFEPAYTRLNNQKLYLTKTGYHELDRL